MCPSNITVDWHGLNVVRSLLLQDSKLLLHLTAIIFLFRKKRVSIVSPISRRGLLKKRIILFLKFLTPFFPEISNLMLDFFGLEMLDHLSWYSWDNFSKFSFHPFLVLGLAVEYFSARAYAGSQHFRASDEPFLGWFFGSSRFWWAFRVGLPILSPYYWLFRECVAGFLFSFLFSFFFKKNLYSKKNASPPPIFLDFLPYRWLFWPLWIWDSSPLLRFHIMFQKWGWHIFELIHTRTELSSRLSSIENELQGSKALLVDKTQEAVEVGAKSVAAR